MKRIITRNLVVMILAAMLISLGLNYYLEIRAGYDSNKEAAKDLFWQIEQILKQNEEETEEVKKGFQEDCLIRAKAAAYMVQYRPEMIQDQKEMEKVADLLQVDEFHIFDTEGNLYAGSQPKYFGLNFHSGEQMAFFLPMLSDRSLELCQEITPNTAEEKLMQYAAVWREDGEGIVQIGMEPSRVLNAMKKNELSYIFSLLTSDKGAIVYAIDPETYRVLGCTSSEYVGEHAADIGLHPDKMKYGEGTYHTVWNGEKNYCVFKVSSSVILARTYEESKLFQDINRNNALLALYLLFLSFAIIFFILKYLDCHIIKSISSINKKLVMIAKGNLDTKLTEKTTPEFAKLSDCINEMVKSLLDFTDKLSVILDTVKIPIGVYEYNPSMKRVMVTSRVKDILMLTEDEESHLLSDYVLFEKKIDEIRRHPIREESMVFQLSGKERFVRLESFVYEKSVMGIVIDVTEDTKERQCIEQERDVDLLTGLYSRRAFHCRVDKLFYKENQLEHAMFVMIDADNLKWVNDRYGHQNGDRYLQAIADALRFCKAKNKIMARLGGDEFVIFFYGCSDKKEVMCFVKEMMRVREHGKVRLSHGIEISTSFSIGYALYPEDGNNSHTLIRVADERMYQEKKKRKGKSSLEIKEDGTLIIEREAKFGAYKE